MRTELKNAGDSKRALEMQAYMKSSMVFHGVPSPVRRLVCKKILADVAFESADVWQEQVLGIWRGAKFREERYCAIQLAGDKRARAFQTPKMMPMYEELIVSGAWWDFVDELAAHHVGYILEHYPKVMTRKMLSWSKCSNLWKRRTSILCQLTFKESTDLDFLYACIEPSLDSKEFFLRKAIGWALRQYAWKNPAEIKRYVKKNEKRLSPLSRREALKNLS